MSIPQVGQGSVAVVPTFRGFRRTTDAQFSASAKSGKSIFDRGFSAAGASSGKGFAASFNSATKGVTAGTIKVAQAEVAKASREVSALRIKEADAVGKVRVAEAALAEARRRYASDSSQVIRAEERLASVQRSSVTAKENLLGATQRLTSAQKDLSAATLTAANSGGRAGGTFARLNGVFGDAGRNGASRFSQGFKDVLGGVLGANILTGIGYTVGRTIGDGIRAGVGFTLDSITLASDLEQSTGAVQAQFKDQADVMIAAAKNAATSVGLSRSTFQQYSAVVGAQLKNLGLRQDQVGQKTIDLITLGADLAAQFGGPTSQAVEALSSLLRGERDPIERYGVSLKQADIDARLAQMGLKGLTGEAEKQAQITATLALLWEQTADSQGTFAREQDTYAGKLQRLNAQLVDSQTKFGEALLPTATDMLQFATDDLLPVLQSTLAEVGPQLNQSLKDSLPEIEATLKTLADVIPEAIDLGAQVGQALSWSIEGDFGDGGIFGGLDQVQSDLEGFGEWLNRDFSTYANWDEYWRITGDGFVNWWDVAWDGIADTAHNRSEELKEYWRSGSIEILQELDAKAADFIRTGELWGDGLAQGFRNRRQTVRDEAALLAGAAIQASAGVMGIKSPATKAIYQGEMWGDGLAIGMDHRTNKVRHAAESLATIPVSTPLGGSSSRAGTAAAIDARQYVTVSPEMDPRIVGRQLGREFVRQTQGVSG